MEFLATLWLPILVSAAAVWFVATLCGMPFLHHKNDWIGLPPGDEDALLEFLQGRGVAPGNYLFPDFRTREQMDSAKVQKALNEGPVGHLSVWQPPLSMGGALAGTFVVYLVVSVLIAYLASVAVPRAASFAKVFQVAGTAGVLAYSFAFVPNALWFGAYRRSIVLGVVDGVLLGLLTGAVFGWFWPR